MYGCKKRVCFLKLLFPLVLVVSSLYADLSGEIAGVLKHSREDFQAAKIMIGIMDAKTGKILTVNIEDKNGTENDATFFNYTYEPGAVIMPFALSIALDKGVVDINTHLKEYDSAAMPIDEGRWIKDSVKISPMTLSNILSYSSNIGAAQIALKTSAKTLKKGLESFGFSQKSGIDVDMEAKGYVKESKVLEQKVNRVAISIGYGILATPIQLMKAYSVFVNEGDMLTPYLHTKKEQKRKRVVSKLTAKEIKGMLLDVVEKGTGVKASVKGLKIGGKTGTAQIAIEGSYTKSYNSSFYGFVEDNRGDSYVIGVLIVDAKRDKLASDCATLVFKEIVDTLKSQNMLSL